MIRVPLQQSVVDVGASIVNIIVLVICHAQSQSYKPHCGLLLIVQLHSDHQSFLVQFCLDELGENVSICYLNTFLLRVGEVLEPFSAVTGCEAKHTLDRSTNVVMD